MKIFRSLLAGCVLLFATNASAAVVLSAVPGFTDAMPGDSVTIDIVISGLGAGGPDSLGDFDLDVVYDSTALSVTGFTLTSLLGDFGLGEAADLSLGDDTFGTIGLAVISTLFDFELDALQPASFVLASIDFSVDVLAMGDTTEVAIGTVFGLGDALGDPLAVMGTSSATIGNGVVDVDEPAAILLLAFPLLMLFRRNRRNS